MNKPTGGCTFASIRSKLSRVCGIACPVTFECAHRIFIGFRDAVHDNLPLLARSGRYEFLAHFSFPALLVVTPVASRCNPQRVVRRKCLCVQLETLDKILVLSIRFDAMDLA